MHANATLIHTLYEAFQAKDFRRMGACYHDAATFRDGAFDLRNGAEIRAMWEMLISSGRDLSVAFGAIQADETGGSAHWEATYTFSKS